MRVLLPFKESKILAHGDVNVSSKLKYINSFVFKSTEKART